MAIMLIWLVQYISQGYICGEVEKLHINIIILLYPELFTIEEY